MLTLTYLILPLIILKQKALIWHPIAHLSKHYLDSPPPFSLIERDVMFESMEND